MKIDLESDLDKLGWKHPELAKRTERSRQYVDMLVSGERPIIPAFIADYRKALNDHLKIVQRIINSLK